MILKGVGTGVKVIYDVGEVSEGIENVRKLEKGVKSYI